MVSAVLDGRKTQTRRTTGLKKINEDPDRYLFHKIEGGVAVFYDVNEGVSFSVKIPYGLPGSFLWVREKFCYGEIVCGDYVAPDPEPLYVENCEGKDKVVPFQYVIAQDIGFEDVKWKPSIFMFRKDSRINLEIIEIRVERLNYISEEDAICEGISPCGITIKNATTATWKDYLGRTGAGFESPKESFISLWESINGKKEACSCKSNPFLWCLTFKKL